MDGFQSKFYMACLMIGNAIQLRFETVWTQIRLDRMPGPDLDPSCLTLMLFMKECFEKSHVEKYLPMTKKLSVIQHAKN